MKLGISLQEVGDACRERVESLKNGARERVEILERIKRGECLVVAKVIVLFARSAVPFVFSSCKSYQNSFDFILTSALHYFR